MTIVNFGFDTGWLFLPIIVFILVFGLSIWIAVGEGEVDPAVFGGAIGAVVGILILGIIYSTEVEVYTDDVNRQFEITYGVYLTEDSQNLPNHANPDPAVIQFTEPNTRTYDVCTATLDEYTSVITVMCGGEILVPAESN